MNFTVILELATLIAFAVIVLGGKQKRDQGWKIICGLLGLSIVVQCASMATVVRKLLQTFRSRLSWPGGGPPGSQYLA